MIFWCFVSDKVSKVSIYKLKDFCFEILFSKYPDGDRFLYIFVDFRTRGKCKRTEARTLVKIDKKQLVDIFGDNFEFGSKFNPVTATAPPISKFTVFMFVFQNSAIAARVTTIQHIYFYSDIESHQCQIRANSSRGRTVFCSKILLTFQLKSKLNSPNRSRAVLSNCLHSLFEAQCIRWIRTARWEQN